MKKMIQLIQSITIIKKKTLIKFAETLVNHICAHVANLKKIRAEV